MQGNKAKKIVIRNKRIIKMNKNMYRKILKI